MVGSSWIEQCGTITVGSLPLLLVLFLAGLTGGVTHCVTMCGVFVLGQQGGLGQQGSVAGASLVRRLLLPYHLGRLTTYTALGVVAGFSFHFLAGWPGFAVIRRLMLALVAMIFLTTLAGRLMARFGLRLPFGFGAKFFAAKLGCGLPAQLSQKRSAWQRYGLGLSLGLLPCGMVMAGLMAVATTGSPLVGGLGMALFALGTAPGLIGFGLLSERLLRGLPRLQDWLTVAALGVNGVLLLGLALG